MNSEPTWVDPTIEAWLDEPVHLPEDGLAGALRQASETPQQRHPWPVLALPRRSHDMNLALRFAAAGIAFTLLGAAALTLVAQVPAPDPLPAVVPGSVASEPGIPTGPAASEPVSAPLVSAAVDDLLEWSQTGYKVYPAHRRIEVRTRLYFTNEGDEVLGPRWWGPVIVDERASGLLVTEGITDRGAVIRTARGDALDGPWEGLWIRLPKIEPGKRAVASVAYVLDAASSDGDGEPPITDETTARFCVIGQDTDRGFVAVRMVDDFPWVMTQAGTPIPDDDTAMAPGWSWRTTGQGIGEVSTCFDGERGESATLPDAVVDAPSS